MEPDNLRLKWDHLTITMTVLVNTSPHRITHLQTMGLVQRIQDQVTKKEIRGLLENCLEMMVKMENHVATTVDPVDLHALVLLALGVDQDTTNRRTKGRVRLDRVVIIHPLKMLLRRRQEEQPMFLMEVVMQE